MASHQNDDHGNPEMNRALRKLFNDKAAQMTKAQLNTITAGITDEKPLYQEIDGGVHVTRMPDDPLAMRISVGAPHDLDEGSYLVFRGSPSKAIELLEQSIVALRRMHKMNVR